MKRTISLLLLAVLLAFAGDVYAQKAIKLGHFNSAELTKRMPDADSVQTVLRDYISHLEADFTSLRDEYARSSADYAAKKDQLSDLLRQSKEKELKNAEANLQETYQSLQDSIQTKQTELMNGIIAKIRAAVAEIAKEDKYTYVLESNSILWYAEESEDITPKLVKKLNLR
ncbi:MAG: OmpH family outer membrane protein [Bacteroidales bacterium]|jgi:outer membrane protein|nr:OmpH family outer membrane protein [Bacteroidales bacterium]